MKTLIVLFLVFFKSIELDAKSANNCNDVCQTKSYGLNKDGMVGCSGTNCLMEASFRSNLINGQIVFNINLIGYGYAAYEDPTFSVVLEIISIPTEYYCWPGVEGYGEAQVSKKTTSYFNGSAKISDGNLYCSWYMMQSDDIWPSSDSNIFTLLNYREIAIYFTVERKTFAIASDISELPIYHLQSLKCCHMVHGNDNYQLIVEQTNEKTEFFMQAFVSDPTILSAKFIDSNGRQLVFDCYILNYMKAYLKTEEQTYDITDQLSSISVSKPSQCSWSLPLTINGPSTTYETKNEVYDLEILVNVEVVYTESGVSLKGFGTTKMANLMIIFSSIAIHFLIH